MKTLTIHRIVTATLFAIFLALASGGHTNAQEAVQPRDQSESTAIVSKKLALKGYIRERLSLNDTLAERLIELQKTNDLRDANFEHLDNLGVSNESFSEVVRMLQTQKVELAIDLAGLEARREFLSDALESTEQKRSSELLAPLQAVLSLEEQALKKVEALTSRGSASSADVQDAKRRVLLAQVRIAEAKQKTDSNSKLQDDLLSSSLERAEKQARLQHVTEMLGALTKSRTKILATEEYSKTSESLSNEIEHLKKVLREIEREIANAKAELKNLTGEEFDDQ